MCCWRQNIQNTLARFKNNVYIFFVDHDVAFGASHLWPLFLASMI